MSYIAYIAGALEEGGEPSGRAVAFDRWLPLFAAVAGRQGGWAEEALTTRRCRHTKFRRLNVAARPPIRINCTPEATPSPVRNVQPAPSRSRRTSTANAEELKLYGKWLPKFVADLERQVSAFERAKRVDMTRVFNQIVFTSERRDAYELEGNPVEWTEAILAKLATRVSLTASLVERIQQLAQRASQSAG